MKEDEEEIGQDKKQISQVLSPPKFDDSDDTYETGYNEFRWPG